MLAYYHRLYIITGGGAGEVGEVHIKFPEGAESII